MCLLGVVSHVQVEPNARFASDRDARGSAWCPAWPTRPRFESRISASRMPLAIDLVGLGVEVSAADKTWQMRGRNVLCVRSDTQDTRLFRIRTHCRNGNHDRAKDANHGRSRYSRHSTSPSRLISTLLFSQPHGAALTARRSTTRSACRRLPRRMQPMRRASGAAHWGCVPILYRNTGA